MGSHAGLKKVVKTVRGKKGTVRRSYWVKAAKAVAATAALAGAAYLGHKALQKHGIIKTKGANMIWKGSVAHPSQSADARVWKGSVGHPSQSAAARIAPGSVGHPGGARANMAAMAPQKKPGLLTRIRDRVSGAKTWSGSVAHSSNQPKIWSGSAANRNNLPFERISPVTGLSHMGSSTASEGTRANRSLSSAKPRQHGNRSLSSAKPRRRS